METRSLLRLLQADWSDLSPSPPQVRDWWLFLPKTTRASGADGLIMPRVPSSSSSWIDKQTYCAMVVVVQMVGAPWWSWFRW